VTGQQIRVLVADDHPVVRLGVRAILSTQPDFTVVADASDGEEAVRLVGELKPDVLILDLVMPHLPGLEALREITAGSHPVKTLLLTGTIDQKQVLEALQLGARGVVLKEAVSDELVDAIRAIDQGQHWIGGRVVTNLVQVLKDLMAATAPPPRKTFGLSAREQEVVALVVEGCTNKDVGSQLGISEETVKRHLTNIFDKTGVSNRLELALFALHHGLGPTS
jgi:two-component system nitrate/nitrite response regulator NarL